jgi:hypothetical protein
MLISTKFLNTRKIILHILFFYLIAAQICFEQWVQTNGPEYFKIDAFADNDTYLFAAAEIPLIMLFTLQNLFFIHCKGGMS